MSPIPCLNSHQKIALNSKKITSSKNILQKAFENSLQANIIFLVADGSIVQANKAACQLLGYSKKLLLTKNRRDIFNITDPDFKKLLKRRKEKGSAKGDVFIVRKSGKLVPCEVNSVIFKDENGIANSILSIVDLRERLIKQEIIDIEHEKEYAINISTIQSKSDQHQAEENVNWIKSIAKTSYDVIWDWNTTTKLISFGKNYENVFGKKLPQNKITFAEWMNSFDPKDRKIIRRKINRIFELKKSSWEDYFPFTSATGVVGEVICRANVLRDEQRKIIRIIGVIHDLSKIRTLEDSLLQALTQKERQIVDAIVESKEIERTNIGNELHDNINQLLGASMLYLDMARRDGKNGEIYLIHSSEYTLTAIDEIRKLTKGISSTTIKDYGLCGAIEHMTADIMEASGVKIHFSSDYSVEDKFNEKFKLNLYRILQEQLNNIIKHANAPNIYIALTKSDIEFTVSISDDGVGYDISQKRTGVGISNIISRANIYKGIAVFNSEQGKGSKLLVTFPITELCLE